jgi:hypothetical protein
MEKILEVVQLVCNLKVFLMRKFTKKLAKQLEFLMQLKTKITKNFFRMWLN